MQLYFETCKLFRQSSKSRIKNKVIAHLYIEHKFSKQTNINFTSGIKKDRDYILSCPTINLTRSLISLYLFTADSICQSFTL